jgi:predicted permease
VEGFTKGPDTDVMTQINIVGPDFFQTLGARLIAGREFTAADRIDTPTVVVVNQAFAKKFNLGTDAIGKRMAFGDNPLSMEIVGLVRDAKLAGVKEDVPPFVVLPYRQVGEIPELRFYVRTTADPAQSLRAVTDVVGRLDPNLPVRDLKTMPQQVRENVFLDRMIGTLSAAFAALATLLAAIGLYGVLAYTVAQRTREIGVRMALGADGRQVRGMILKQVGKMLLIGTVIGLVAALVLGRAVASLLYAMESNDPVVILAAVALLALVTLGAGYIPALRASRVDPVQALRYE